MAHAGSKNDKVIQSVIGRLIKKMETTGTAIWQPSHFTTTSDAYKNGQYCPRNFYTGNYYSGVNILFLWGGSGYFITPKQLQAYNQKHKTKFWFKAGTPQDTIIRMTNSQKWIPEQQALELINSGKGRYVKQVDGQYYQVYNSALYSSVIDCAYIHNPEGECIIKLEKKPQAADFEPKAEAEKMIQGYMKETGVTFKELSRTPHYSEMGDYVALPPKANYRNQEVYYRDFFHELIHSTGIATRLNRPEFAEYMQRNQRSREELIAESGSMMLTVMAGYDENSVEADNSANYVKGWCNWMKDNPQELFRGFLETQKAVEYFNQQSRKGLGIADTNETDQGEPAAQTHAANEAIERIPTTRKELLAFLTAYAKRNNDRGVRTLTRIVNADKAKELQQLFKTKAMKVGELPVFTVLLPNKCFIDIGMSFAIYTDTAGVSKILFSLDREHTLQDAQRMAAQLKHQGVAQLVSYMDLRKKIK